MTPKLSLAIESAMTRRPAKVKVQAKPDTPLFYDDNPRGVQVWYSLHKGKVQAHLQDGPTEYVGVGSDKKKAIKALENVVPTRHHHTTNYMRVCYWLTH